MLTQYGRGTKGSLYMEYSGLSLSMNSGRYNDSADTMYLQEQQLLWLSSCAPGFCNCPVLLQGETQS